MQTTKKKQGSAGAPPHRSAILAPEPRPALSRQELEIMMIGLPAIMKGAEECGYVLKTGTAWVQKWLRGPIGGIPAIPHFPMADGRHVFLTVNVIQWLWQWFPEGSVRVARGRGGNGGESPVESEVAA